MEVINNEEFESLDEGSDQDRERRALIRNLGKEKRCNLGQKGLQIAVDQLFPNAEHSEYDKEACQWLKQIPPVHWARSHFSGRAVSDVLISNMCEVFNGKIEKGRDKPLWFDDVVMYGAQTLVCLTW
ncbi:unnamed protein product [Lactuca saligna]|uniref:Uncharacterized protein n=1 Tax=Lactuca saligna TaxID=75948 RepID=A0AA35V645_LACSI|nr:unnamed protein product [Lactuca saligna]